jgi:hypothetical protein
LFASAPEYKAPASEGGRNKGKNLQQKHLIVRTWGAAFVAQAKPVLRPYELNGCERGCDIFVPS